MGTTDQTVASYMDRIAAQYGLEAIETKTIDDRGDLEPISKQRFALLSDHVLVQWIEMAIRQPEWIPEVVDLEQLLDGIDYDQLVETQDTKLLGDIATLRAQLPLGQEEQPDSNDNHQLEGENW
ncbi:hypothetical protein OB955_19295 [Halobacteria archaeon AArc-m2/3/4]|uniref:Uncharacterized protein n=1 Tax=Natronoglomus mannanivorans TaxID=2979990 RepID=A0ABT2QIV4_9EURY|nr:hypothetical protein [Halobacteria archaeon AArc-m2/3/4]